MLRHIQRVVVNSQAAFTFMVNGMVSFLSGSINHIGFRLVMAFSPCIGIDVFRAEVGLMRNITHGEFLPVQACFEGVIIYSLGNVS
ncbi:Uncharacterised protein [Shigella sonnei]|nr:Uncharacterised protein [Shigella sonnei]